MFVVSMGPASFKQSWQEILHIAINMMIEQRAFGKILPLEHFKDTPNRVVAAFEEYFKGVSQNPADQLKTSFTEEYYNEMIVLADVDFVSHCAHHLSPFIGTYTFAYIPTDKIVGLSKVPRMIEVLCARPQVQEHLAKQIVQVFQDTVNPKGCGVVIDAVHTCACIRGVRKKFTTRTTALAGCFLEPAVKAELLMAVKKL